MTSPDVTPADVLVIFGITGDLARKMTFRSLYRLERRGLLDCPIVGVALDDWSEAALIDHAKSAIETAGETSRLTIVGIDRPQEVADHIQNLS
jgi:glucose-6-phosphate 1-dehydrogenase